MKIIVFIFSLYLTGIISFPCTDDLGHPSNDETQMVDIQGESEDDCEDENCSPFCTCQCCHTSTPKANPLIEETTPIAASIPTSLNSIYLRQIVLSIWDPPRRA